MRLVVLKEIPEDPLLRQQWNALVLRMEQPQVFYTHEWALAVYRAYHKTLEPLLFLAYDEHETLCGVAALATDVAGQRVTFLVATTGDYCDFLSASEHRRPFVSAVLGELKQRHTKRMDLANLPADSDSVAAIRDASRQHGFFCFQRTAYVCAQVEMAALERRGGDKPVLPRKKMLRRFLNAMGRQDPVRLDHARQWEELEPHLAQFMQAHVARFLFTGRISNMAWPERRMFLTELAHLLSEEGWITLTRMMSADRVFAWNYGLQFQGTWFWYQPTFDSDLEKYSAGFCLLAKVIEEAADNPQFRMVDLGLGAEDYKERFANRTRETLFITIRSSPVQHGREITRYRAATLVKKSPKLESVVRRVLRAVKDTNQFVRRQSTSSILSNTGKQLAKRVKAESEVLFYEWTGTVQGRSSGHIQALELSHMATAVMQYVNEQETLDYLLRSARRLRAREAEGFVLLDSEGMPVHFAWIRPFDGCFVPKLNAAVEAGSPGDLLLFDSWTPIAVRGLGYFGQTVDLIASQAAGSTWICASADDDAMIRGLARTGFEKRYSLSRSSILGWQKIRRSSGIHQQPSRQEVAARS